MAPPEFQSKFSRRFQRSLEGASAFWPDYSCLMNRRHVIYTFIHPSSRIRVTFATPHRQNCSRLPRCAASQKSRQDARVMKVSTPTPATSLVSDCCAIEAVYWLKFYSGCTGRRPIPIQSAMITTDSLITRGFSTRERCVHVLSILFIRTDVAKSPDQR